MSDKFSALRLFVRVARLGSFSAGGRDLGVPQPTVSRIISQLERELGALLFIRTTRAVSLTEAGQDYLARIEPILMDLEEADQAARGTGELRGTLRVGLSSSFAVRQIVPILPAFMERHPHLHVEFLMSDQRQDFILEGVDVGLRFGPLQDSTATAKRIASLERAMFAAPAYVEREGMPAAPSDLEKHSFINVPSRIGRKLNFRKDGEVRSVSVGGRFSVTLSEVGLAAAVAGIGIITMSALVADKEVKEGALVRLLPDWAMDDIDLHAIFPAGKAAKPAARAFVDYLMGCLPKSLGDERSPAKARA